MKLPSLPFGKKAENVNYFLALILRHEKISAVTFKEAGSKVHIVGEHEERFHTTIEAALLEELLDILDKAIAAAEQNLPENVQTHKTVFGVKESWVEDTKIKKEYLAKLKRISDELSLEPIGFLTISEAIAHLLQKEEGAPVSAILVETGNKFLTASLIRAGKIVETKSVEIQEQVTTTVDSLLKHFTSMEILPSRLILFDGPKGLSQEFISFQWSKTLPFLHMPQVIQLSPGFEAKAVLFGAATQMGFAIDDFHSQDDNKDVELKHIEKKEHTDFFGFKEGVDVAQKKEEPPDATYAFSNEDRKEHIEEIPEEVKIEHEERKPLGNQGAMIASGLGLVINSLKKMKGTKRLLSVLPLPKSAKGMVILPLGILLVFFVFFSYFFLFSANVTITLSNQTVQKTQNVLFASDKSTSVSDKVLASTFESISEDGSVSSHTTGKKDIGNKAKGVVTIFNNNDSDKTIAGGTVFTSESGRTFTLDSDVTVASASGDVFSGTHPGTVNTKLTATTFGTEYNLPSATKFSVSGSSTIAAKNDNAFSGGTKQTVSVVAKADLDTLESDLIKNLQQKAQGDFMRKVGPDKATIPSFISTSVDKKNLDKKLGDEGSQVTLNATVSYQGIVYSKSDMTDFAKALLTTNLPSNMQLNSSAISTNISNVSKKNGSEIATDLIVSAKLFPHIDTNKLSEQIAGKSYTDATQTINLLSHVANIAITPSPHIPFLPQIMPPIKSHIHIYVVNE